jgi:hypothetical protein
MSPDMLLSAFLLVGVLLMSQPENKNNTKTYP